MKNKHNFVCNNFIKEQTYNYKNSQTFRKMAQMQIGN